jgi:hypothetical protein
MVLYELDYMHDFRLPPRCKWDLCSSGCYEALIDTDISGHLIAPIFKVKDCFMPEDGTVRLSRNVGNYQTTPRNTPE